MSCRFKTFAIFVGMKVETKNLIRIKTYADSIGKTTQWVYKCIKSGKLDVIKIDGVQFIEK